MIVDGIVRSIVGKLLASKAKDAEAGKLGPFALKLATFAQGHVTETSFLLGCLLVPALIATGNDAMATWAAVLAGAGVSAGLVRKSWNDEVPPEVLNSGWYKSTAAHAGDIASAFAVAAGAVETCEPSTVAVLAKVHLTCNGAAIILGVVAGIWAHLGLSANAKLAPPPVKK